MRDGAVSSADTAISHAVNMLHVAPCRAHAYRVSCSHWGYETKHCVFLLFAIHLSIHLLSASRPIQQGSAEIPLSAVT